MNRETVLADCRDPVVALVLKQRRAIDLILRGLRPKQISIITSLNIKRVRDLCAGLMPSDERAARTPKRASTIIRQSKARIAASILVGAYRRIVGGSKAVLDKDYSLFVKAYDFYTVLAAGVQEVIPLLPIEDAFTIIHAHHHGEITLARCEKHDIQYVVVPDHDRGRKCPHCAFEVLELNQPGSSYVTKPAGAMPDLGYRPGQFYRQSPATIGE